MDWLSWILLESPAALAVPAAVALFAALVFWRRKGRVRPLLVTLAIVAVLFVVQATVVTRREQIDRVLRPLEKDIAAARVGVLDGLLTHDFETEATKRGSLNRAEFLNLARRQLQYVRLHWLERRRLVLAEATADETLVRVWYTADVSLEGMSGTARTGWNVTFRRTPDGWKIARLGCRQIGAWRTPDWRDLGHR